MSELKKQARLFLRAALAEVHPAPCKVSDLTDWAKDVGEGIDDILSFVGAFILTHHSEEDVVVTYHQRPELAEQAVALVFMFGELDAKQLTSFIRKTFPKTVFTEASLSIALALDSRLARLPGGGYSWQDSDGDEEPAEDLLQRSLARLDIAPLELQSGSSWGILGFDGVRWIAAPGAHRAPDLVQSDNFPATPLSFTNRTHNAIRGEQKAYANEAYITNIVDTVLAYLIQERLLLKNDTWWMNGSELIVHQAKFIKMALEHSHMIELPVVLTRQYLIHALKEMQTVKTLTFYSETKRIPGGVTANCFGMRVEMFPLTQEMAF